MIEKHTWIFEYKKLKSGKYSMYLSTRTAYSHDVDGGKIGEAFTYAQVMEKKEELMRQAKRSDFKFESHRLK